MYATNGYVATATFTPAASSHVAPRTNGAAAEFVFLNKDGAPPPAGSQLRLLWSSLLLPSATIETTAWALHFFNVTPPSALADDAAFDIAAGDRASYLGSIAIAQIVDLGTTNYIEGVQTKLLKLLGTSAFAYLVNGTTLTTQAVAHSITLHAEAI
jgi:hypothetical protein